MSYKLNIFIVDDHSIFREGIKFIISQIDDYNFIGEAENGAIFIDKIQNIEPDIVLMDISMPIMDGETATKKAIALYPNIKIITLSSYGNEVYYYNMIKAGVLGFVLKDAGKDELKEAINTIAQGGNYFPPNVLRKILFKVGNINKKNSENELIQISEREKEVLKLICKGHSNIEIAEILFISPKTVDNHRTHLLAKTNARNTANLVMHALKNRLIEI